VLQGIFLARPEQARAGIRLAVKDLFDTDGLVTTYGSAIFVDHVPQETAEAVRRLEVAGYANVGKTNLHEFAYGVTSENPHFGTVPNPIAPDRVAGGSSGGSAAAVAAGLADLGLGTDSGGSIRIPAACCGVVGFKPSYGLVPLEGCFPLAPSFDHAGPIGPDVASCAEAMRHLAPAFEPLAVDLADLAVGVAWLETAEPLVRERVAAAAARFPGARPIELARRDDDVYALFRHEVADVHRELFADHGDLYGEDVRIKLESCLAVTDAEAHAAARARDGWREEAEATLAGLDLVLTPTLGQVPPLRNRDATGDLDVRERLIRNTFAFNAFGWPALALPCRPSEHGLPASVQLVGRHGADALVLGAGLSLERGTAFE
jgi:aspartyl-tRNA(Asn)/glutamyl-tRNA(Gln) amidotransferase subunit A